MGSVWPGVDENAIAPEDRYSPTYNGLPQSTGPQNGGILNVEVLICSVLWIASQKIPSFCSLAPSLTLDFGEEGSGGK